MEYSTSLPIEQVIQEKRSFHLDEVFKEGWRVFKKTPLRFFTLCFPVLILRDVADFLYPMTGVLGEAFLWSFLPVCAAYLTWSILQGEVGSLTSNLPSWTTLQNPYRWCLMVAFLGIVLDWTYEPLEEQVSQDEEMLEELFFIPSVGLLFSIIYLPFVVCSPFAILCMAERGMTIKDGIKAGIGTISHQIVKVFLLHLGWMFNTGVLALLVGGVGGYIITSISPENLFIISMESPMEFGILAEDVSEKTGTATLNLLVLALEYVGLGIGYGLGLCTVAVAYTQVFGLPSPVAIGSTTK